MQISSKIFIASHNGLVGSALVRRLKDQGFNNLILRPRDELDLTNQLAVERFFVKEKPEYIFLAAAKVGGIHANSTYPAEFIFSNMQVQMNVINESYRSGVKKLLFLGLHLSQICASGYLEQDSRFIRLPAYADTALAYPACRI